MDAPVNRSMPDDLIRLALETTTEGILGVDVQGSVTFANPSACRLLGYTADEMNGQIIEDLIHRESNGARQSIDESPLRAAYRFGKACRVYSDVFQCKDSTRLLVEYSAAPLIRNDALAGATVNFHDIFERNRIEQDLHQSSFLAKMALELTGSGYWHVDYNDPDYYTQSELAARIVGEEIKPDGRYHLQDEWFSRLIDADPELAQKTDELYQGAIEGRYKHYDAIYAYKRPADQRIVWLHASGKVVRDASGKALHMYGVYQDITEAKRAEQEIKASERRVRETEEFYRSVLELAPDGLMVVDDHGVIELANAQCEHLFGCPRTRLIGQSIEALVPTDRPWRAILREISEETPVLREMGVNRDLCGLHKDGTPFPVEIGLSALPAGNRTGAKVAVSILDISERKQQENALKQAKARAEEATEMKSLFLANMSHEMRTPMNAVIGLAHLALKTELTPKQHDYIGKIHHAGRSLLSVINDILDFSKIEAGKLDIEEIDFALDDIISSVTTLTGQRAHDKGIEFLANVPSSIPVNLIGDPMRVGQILTNLVNNAIKFTEKGEIRLRTECVERSEAMVELQFSVSDTGIGMSPEQVSRLFQPFTQADMSTTRKHGGTGLGLTISRKLVEMMGGRIWLESELNVGSTFFFTVPFGIGAETGSRHVVPSQLKKLRVLVVDDSAAAREILLDALCDITGSIDAVGSGAEAIEAIGRHEPLSPYDIVFMDWQMPGMSGLAAIRRIKANQAIAHQPRIVLVTALGREEVREEAEQLGIDRFLMKPVTRSMLIDSLVTIFAPGAPELSRAVADCDPQRLRGIRVLLAEDNEINQQIAVELLQGVGALVDVVENGRAAIDMLTVAGAEQRYDLVLTDLQMPEMDGYQVATHIRADARFRHLPIIAMTAHAIVEERERCFAVGMDDHVSKPIDADDLFETVSRHCRPLSLPSTSLVRTDPIEALSRIEDLDTVSGLRRVAGNKELYVRLLRQFVGQHTRTPKLLSEQFTRSDLEVIERNVHSLRGVAGNLGAQAVERAARSLEQAIHDRPEPSRLNALALTLSKTLAELLAQLTAVLGMSAAHLARPDRPLNPARARAVVAQMLQQLWVCDISAVETLESNRSTLSLLFANGGFERFERNVRAYAFGEAHASLKLVAKTTGTGS
jgi:PAS domain S-box-containing protein